MLTEAEKRQQAFEDGFVLGAKLIELTLEGAFKIFGGDNLGLPPITYDEEVEEGKTFCWNMYKDADKEAVLAHFQKRLKGLL